MAEVLPAELATADWCYLPLSSEILPLLKWGFLPLRRPDQPWMLPHKAAAAAVSEQDYLKHMQREYQRLGDNLRSLLTFEQFLQQAQSKRREIEQALQRYADDQAEQAMPDPERWRYQHFYRELYSSLAWQQGNGLANTWLALDPQAFSQPFQPVLYADDAPVRFQQRLCSAPRANSSLQQYSLVLPATAIEKQVTIEGQQLSLIKLPARAVKLAVMGAAVPLEFRKQFIQFWRSDMRYQRLPLGQMVWPQGDYRFRIEQL